MLEYAPVKLARAREAGVQTLIWSIESFFDPRPHVAGHCHTGRHGASGVVPHVYGPHIFHTDDDEVVWAVVNRFMRFRPDMHRVKVVAGGPVYGRPINLQPLDQFFGRLGRFRYLDMEASIRLALDAARHWLARPARA